MQPRIYTYKVTFEEIPDWYWGSHKEKKYEDGYLGSPVTHVWKWEFYTPILEICELFPYTDEGWKEARKVEDRCIRPDLNNSLCLNENVGGSISLEANRRGGKRCAEMVHADKDDLGRSIFAVKGAAVGHKNKDELGRSLHALKAFEGVNDEKDDLGRSITAVKGGTAGHENKDELGRSVNAVKAGKKGGVAAHENKDDFGRSINGVKAAEAMNSQKWKDPFHPELGEHNSGVLVRKQKRQGYPHSKENRVRVG